MKVLCENNRPKTIVLLRGPITKPKNARDVTRSKQTLALMSSVISPSIRLLYRMIVKIPWKNFIRDLRLTSITLYTIYTVYLKKKKNVVYSYVVRRLFPTLVHVLPCAIRRKKSGEMEILEIYYFIHRSVHVSLQSIGVPSFFFFNFFNTLWCYYYFAENRFHAQCKYSPRRTYWYRYVRAWHSNNIDIFVYTPQPPHSLETDIFIRGKPRNKWLSGGMRVTENQIIIHFNTNSNTRALRKSQRHIIIIIINDFWNLLVLPRAVCGRVSSSPCFLHRRFPRTKPVL